MNGFNYFALNHSAKGRKAGLRTKHILIVFAFLLIACLLVYVFFFYQVLQRQRQLAFLQEIKLNEDFNKQYTTATRIDERVQQAEQ